MASRRSNNPGPELDAAQAAATVLELREAPRVAADFPVEIHSPGFDAPLRASARDISTGGLCFATASRVALDSLRSVTLTLPEGRTRFNIEGKWQTTQGLDDAVLTGAVFVGLLPAEVASLWDVVDKTGREIGGFLYEALREEGASLDDAMAIAQTTRMRVVPRGRFVYQRHEAQAPGDDSIFIVRQGSVELTLPIRAGREIRLGKVGPGAILGGLGSVTGMLPLESAQTHEETSLLEVSKSAFSYLRVAKPLLAHWLGQVITSGYLRRMDGVLSRLAEEK
jgi:hypothetical protein